MEALSFYIVEISSVGTADTERLLYLFALFPFSFCTAICVIVRLINGVNASKTLFLVYNSVALFSPAIDGLFAQK